MTDDGDDDNDGANDDDIHIVINVDKVEQRWFAFELPMIIDGVKFNILIPVWLTLYFCQGNSCMTKQKIELILSQLS